MSRHSITVPFGKKSTRTIVAGFDRQSQSCFLQLFRNDEHIPIEVHSFDLDIDEGDAQLLEKAFKQRRIKVPLSFFKQIGFDALNQVGNRIVHWNPDGSIKQEFNA